MKNKKESSIFYIARFLALVWRLKPALLACIFLQSIVKSMNIFVTIYIPKLFMDGIQGKMEFSDMSTVLVSILLIKFFFHYAGDMLEHKIEDEKLLFERYVNLNLAEKMNRMKYEALESPEVLELKERAGMALQIGTLSGISESINQVIISAFTLIGIVMILIRFSFGIFVLTTSLACIGIGIEYKIAQKVMKFHSELVPLNRKYNYFFEALNAENRQKEFRVYGNHITLIEKIAGFNFEIFKKLNQVYKVNANASSFGSFFDILAKISIYVYAGLRVLGIGGSKIFLGDFSLLIGINENYSQSIKNLGNSFALVLSGIPNIIPIFLFFELEDRKDVEGAISPSEIESLVFENVSFSYPNTERKILDGVSFTLKKGETLALVGVNNSGKSTIVKLICRLFEPTEGRILWNGTDIKNLKYKDYLKQIATVFQDFKLFPISIGENILTKTLEEGEEISKQKEKRIWDILEELEMDTKIRELPNGLKTLLNKNIHEDATSFSGGQNQKLAIARAVYSDSSFAILDEPTSALDPLAEAEIYGHFSNLVKNKTSIFISHRMSASKFSDRILVLDGGKITGNGSHKELIETNELYRSLYEAQAQYYI